MLRKCGNIARGEADTVSGKEENLPVFTIQISNPEIWVRSSATEW